MADAAFIYSDAFIGYKFSDRHPLRQERLRMVDRLLTAYGVFERGESERIEPTPTTYEQLARVHAETYLDVMRRLSDGERVFDASTYGFGAGDNPPFSGMWEASLLYAGASLDAAHRVLDGRNHYAFNSSGGLHHAMRARAAGFCLVNDNALAAYAALDRGLRVAYIDIDAHHGDGTQALFYDTPDVLTISLHETGRTLFPGTGFVDEIGVGDAEGTSINVPVAPYATDEHYAYAFDEIVEPIVRAYDPGFFILQVGADAHWQDPLAHLQVTSQGWLDMVKRVLALAGERPLIALGGGGYNVRTVARLWTLLQATLAGATLPDDVPAEIGRELGIERLHDVDSPDVSDQERAAAWEYVRGGVGRLKGLVGERWGLTGSRLHGLPSGILPSISPSEGPEMPKLTLVRHGESQWNLENRFTGWVDVPLSPKGEEEARRAGELLKEVPVDKLYTSVLQRAIETARIALDVRGTPDIPVERDKALNERMYGDLQGLNKDETAKKFGAEQVHIWRRSYDIPPPNGESLKDTAARTLPYYREHILTDIKAGKNVLVVAHGNSLRSIVMELDKLSKEQVLELNLATGVPLVYDMDAQGNVLSKKYLTH